MNSIQISIRILFLLTIVTLIIPIGSFGQMEEDGNKLILNASISSKGVENSSQLEFFYDDDCESCIKVKPYIDSLKSAYPEMDFTYHNVCSGVTEGKENLKLFEKYKEDRGLIGVYVPVVFVGDVTIHGEQNITRDLQGIIQKDLGVTSSSERVFVPTPTIVPAPQTIDPEAVEFFFDEHCDSCHKVMPHITTLQSQYPGIQFNFHNVCGKDPVNLRNRSAFDEIKSQTGLINASVPLVSIGSRIIEGDDIYTDLEPALQSIQSSKGTEDGSSIPEQIVGRIQTLFRQ